MTFYLYRDARQPFLETIAPIIFALFASALNAKQFEEFLANVVVRSRRPVVLWCLHIVEVSISWRQFGMLAQAIGFTLVLMVPRLSQNESFLATFQVNHIYVALIFLSLVVSAASIPLSSLLTGCDLHQGRRDWSVSIVIVHPVHEPVYLSAVTACTISKPAHARRQSYDVQWEGGFSGRAWFTETQG